MKPVPPMISNAATNAAGSDNVGASAAHQGEARGDRRETCREQRPLAAGIHDAGRPEA